MKERRRRRGEQRNEMKSKERRGERNVEWINRRKEKGTEEDKEER